MREFLKNLLPDEAIAVRTAEVAFREGGKLARCYRRETDKQQESGADHLRTSQHSNLT